MLKYDSIEELVKSAQESGKTLSDIIAEDQALHMDKSIGEITDIMAESFKVMKESVLNGLKKDTKSPSGLSGGDAYLLSQSEQNGKSICSGIFTKSLAKALAISEYNACMGRIVAAPTAGSCGIIPAVLITIMEEKNIPEEKVIKSLFTASGIGMVIAKKATISGAEGGCQAECGSASAMAAAALVELMDGTPQMSADACAIALLNTMGLVCDPVAGLVEVPCIKRNAMGASNALTSAELALAGINSIIPADEVIMAMKSVGNLMSVTLKETAQGGLANTPTAIAITKELAKK